MLTSAAGGLPPDLAGRVGDLPGVAAASEHVTSNGFVERPHDDTRSEEGWPLQGVTGEGAAASVAVPVLAGSLAASTATRRPCRPTMPGPSASGSGDRVGLRLGDRAPVDLRVVALLDGAGDPPILLPAGLLAAHTTAGRPAQLLIRAAPGVGPAELAADLERLAAPWPEVTVASRDALDGGERQTQAWVNYLLVGMLMAYTPSRWSTPWSWPRPGGGGSSPSSAWPGPRRPGAADDDGRGRPGRRRRHRPGNRRLRHHPDPFSVAATDSPFPAGPPWINLAVVATAALLALTATLLPTGRALRTRPATAVTLE